MHPVTGITPASATEGAAVVFDFALSDPSAVATTYTTLTNGTAGTLDYTTTDVNCNRTSRQLPEQ
jgi:hypothetical protein